MKQLFRLDEPQSFFKGEKKIEFYKDLKDNKGNIRDRWNYSKYQADLRSVLYEISGGECTFCGKKVSEIDFDIEHYLPKKFFPYLSYDFGNYLCSCKYCNQVLKKNFYPESLETIREKLGEPILVDEIEGIIPFDKKEILNTNTDRIIDPTFDEVDKLLEFDPLSCNYRIINSNTIGKNTNKMFFLHREFVVTIQKISSKIQKEILRGSTKEDIMDWANICGYSFYIDKLYDFWADFLRHNFA
jgi:uncharacterized protein (TIGR02646 family)